MFGRDVNDSPAGEPGREIRRGAVVDLTWSIKEEIGGVCDLKIGSFLVFLDCPGGDWRAGGELVSLRKRGDDSGLTVNTCCSPSYRSTGDCAMVSSWENKPTGR